MDTPQTTTPAFSFPRVIDNTMYEDWRQCPHKFFRARCQGLTLAEQGEPGEPLTPRRNIHTHFGSALAKGLEVTRVEYHSGAGHSEALACGAEAILKYWDGQGPLPAPRTRTEEAKTLDNCLLAHVGYFREWDLDDPLQQVMVIDDRPLVELSGARPIPGSVNPDTGEPILYAGRFDAVLDRGQPVGLDDKTTGGHVEGEAWQGSWSLRSQFTGYIWLAEAWGYSMEQFVIHGVQVLKTKCNFAECLEVRPWWMVERWLAQLEADVETMCEQYIRFAGLVAANKDAVDEVRPHPFGQRYGDACHHYNTQCQFTSLCVEPTPSAFLDKYIVQHWDPLRVRDAGEG